MELVQKHGDPRLGPQHSCKNPRVSTHTDHPSTGESETAGSMEFAGQLIWTHTSEFPVQWTLLPQKNKAVGEMVPLVRARVTQAR